MKTKTNYLKLMSGIFGYVLLIVLASSTLISSAHIEEMWRVQESDGSTTFYAETYKDGHGTWDGTTPTGGVALGTSTFSFTNVVFSLPTDAILIERCFRIGGKGDRYLKVNVPTTSIAEGTYALTIDIPGTALDTVILEPECDFPSVLIDYTDPTFTTCPGNDNTCTTTLDDYTGDAVATDNSSTSVTITQSPVAGTSISGTTSVTLTATDDLGNSSTCTFSVTTGGGGNISVSVSSDLAMILLGYAPEECATLSTSITNGTAPYTYSWSSSGTASSEVVCPTSDATYTVTVSDVNGCSGSGSISLTVVDVSCGNNDTKTRMCKTQPNGKKVSICVSTSAVDALKATGATVGTCFTEDNSSGMFSLGNEENDFELDLYPNPFTSQLLVDFVANKSEKLVIEAFDINGKLLGTMFNGDVEKDMTYYGSIDGTDFPQGIILVRFTSNSMTKVVKVQHL
jgi:hypothetical protein